MKIKKHLLAISPQDEKAIKQLIKDICALKTTAMPVMDIKGVKVKQKSSMPLSQLYGYMKAGRTMVKLSKLSIDEYVMRFKHKGIRQLLSAVVSMGDYSAMALLFTLGGLAANDSGYPKVGSLQLAQNMVNTFKSLGGTIEYNKKVDHVNISESKTNGVWIVDQLYPADAVIVTSDTLSAIDHLFTQPLQEAWMNKLRNEIKTINCTFISLGVKYDMSNLPENIVLSLKRPFMYYGKPYTSININNYSTFEGYAPKGCTAITTMFFDDTYDEWKQSSLDGFYQHKKAILAESIIQLLENEIPELKGKVEVWDVATPLTYERYCGAFRGSWMSVMKPRTNSQSYPSKSGHIRNLYFAGQRLMVPGGMPAAMMTSRTAVQYLCKDTDTIFQGKL